jgi:hypothetical protein
MPCHQNPRPYIWVAQVVEDIVRAGQGINKAGLAIFSNDQSA